MAGKIDLFKDKGGGFRFRLKAGNGEIVLASESYKEEAGALNGIESVRKNAGRPGAFEPKTDVGGKPYFVLKAANGEIIGMSETYSSEAARDAGIESVKTCAPDAPISKAY
jgi:uncharacterized protein YegP (UPF0339 family)